MDNFYEVSEDSQNKFFSIFNNKSFPIGIGFQFIANEKQKELIKVQKIPDQYAFILKKDILVTINDELMSLFDDESITILIEQEIDKINFNMDSGKIKLVKTDLNTFSSIVSKYGLDKVTRANQIEMLTSQQIEDDTFEM